MEHRRQTSDRPTVLPGVPNDGKHCHRFWLLEMYRFPCCSLGRRNTVCRWTLSVARQKSPARRRTENGGKDTCYEQNSSVPYLTPKKQDTKGCETSLFKVILTRTSRFRRSNVIPASVLTSVCVTSTAIRTLIARSTRLLRSCERRRSRFSCLFPILAVRHNSISVTPMP